MNTIARRLTPLTLTVATLAALFMLNDGTAGAPSVAPTVLQLEPVHVIGQRVPAITVVQAPRVEVSARRAGALQVLQLPAVEVTARRAADTMRVAQQRPAATPARKPA